MSDDPIYLVPRDEFDDAIITEGHHVIYCYSKLLKILTDDYTRIIMNSTAYRGATLTAIEQKAQGQAKQWLRWLRESAHFNHHRAPIIAHRCPTCRTPVVGELSLCPATEYKLKCTIENIF